MPEVYNAAAIHTTGQNQGQITEWRLSVQEDIETLFKKDGAYKKDVSLEPFGSAAVPGSRVEIFRDDDYTGKCATVVHRASLTEGVVVAYNDDEELRVFLTEDGSSTFKLGECSVELDLTGYNGVIQDVYILPLSQTTADTRLDITCNDANVGNKTIVANTGALVPVSFGLPVNTGDINIDVNAATNDATRCVIYAILKKTKATFDGLPVADGELVSTFDVGNLGLCNVTFRFGQFVRVKRFFVKVKQQTLNDVELSAYSVGNVAIEGDKLTVPGATAAGALIQGAVMDYVTKSVKFAVGADAGSATLATVGVVYEVIGNVINYNVGIPNGNVVTTWVAPDTFDATITSIGLFASSVNAWVKQNFRITVLRDADNVLANADCGDNSVFSAAPANNVFTPASGLKVTNVATGGSTEPVFVKLMLTLA